VKICRNLSKANQPTGARERNCRRGVAVTESERRRVGNMDIPTSKSPDRRRLIRRIRRDQGKRRSKASGTRSEACGKTCGKVT
jgi:hypothetical protein